MALRRTFLYNGSDLTSQDFTTFGPLSWDTVGQDDLNIFDAGSSTTKIVIASDISKIRMQASLYVTNVANNATAFLVMDDTDIITTISNVAGSNSERRLNLTTPVLSVDPGDEIELGYLQLTDSSVTIKANYTWWLIEEVL